MPTAAQCAAPTGLAGSRNITLRCFSSLNSELSSFHLTESSSVQSTKCWKWNIQHSLQETTCFLPVRKSKTCIHFHEIDLEDVTTVRSASDWQKQSRYLVEFSYTPLKLCSDRTWRMQRQWKILLTDVKERLWLRLIKRLTQGRKLQSPTLASPD